MLKYLLFLAIRFNTYEKPLCVILLLKADIETPEQEMNLLGPLRPGPQGPSGLSRTISSGTSRIEDASGDSVDQEPENFDPTILEPDVCKVRSILFYAAEKPKFPF